VAAGLQAWMALVLGDLVIDGMPVIGGMSSYYDELAR
jgi:hypothetical protein